MNKEELQQVLEAHKLWRWKKKGGKRANLSKADLSGANLSWADLSWANLSEADLSEADLYRADLSKANLSGTVLDPEASMPELSDEELLEAGLEIDGDKIYGYRTKHSQYISGYSYESRSEPYIAPYFSVCTKTDCHPGIYLASKAWLQNKYPDKEFVRCYCLRSELIHALDKWRATRIWVLPEKPS